MSAWHQLPQSAFRDIHSIQEVGGLLQSICPMRDNKTIILLLNRSDGLIEFYHVLKSDMRTWGYGLYQGLSLECLRVG